MDFCEIQDIPEEVNLEITFPMKVDRVVSYLLNYKKLGIQVVHLSGFVKRLEECPEVIRDISKYISIFVDKPEALSKTIKRYIENA